MHKGKFPCLFLFIAGCLSLYTTVDAGERPRVLFDAGHAQSSGRHADWIIDDDVPAPKPQEPSSPDDWSGGISSWAYALHKTGRYEVESTNRPLTYGNPENPQDLLRYDVLVLCEPNTDLTPSERAAVVSFVRGGGGLFLIADHFNSDRNDDGIDSTGIFNKLELHTGIHFQGKGEINSWIRGGHYTANFSPDDTPILHGPFGMVELVHLNGFGTIRVENSRNPAVRGHIWLKGAQQVNLNIILATSSLGSGRVAALSDSSPADDGTTNTQGHQLHDNWNQASNSRLLLNATEFLAGAE
ncbi:MAG TPA: hydrolase [Candidatus Avalokitesvara rifleensis]|uniref:hydrolase n=1 Tax=Candidatus Avalokitesvara rifleensis TaxID=3367620 RepID=UPI0027132725|nr:hypothetical protein [Candidatus Brocadiales bacterium]